MLTSKQRAQLRGLANSMDTILQVGKGGVMDPLVKQVDDALTARELIKMRVLETAPQSLSLIHISFRREWAFFWNTDFYPPGLY